MFRRYRNAMTLQEWFRFADDAPTKSEFARMLHKSPGYVGDLCAARCQPSLPVALEIDRLTCGLVPPSSWLTAA
jgi:hypothetical protein